MVLLALKLHVERKVLRKIFGAVCENNECRIRTDAELQILYNAPSVVADIRVRRLTWMGYVE